VVSRAKREGTNGDSGRRTNRSRVPPISLCLLLALPVPASLPAQDSAAVSLEVALEGSTRDPVVRTRNLLEETPWLSALRQGLPVRLQYRLETWRSREAWLDEVQRQVEWTIVVRHEPLLDQFLVTRLGPGTAIVPRRVATAGALAELLGVRYQFQIVPEDEGRYYYTASLAVATLSDSDLDQFERVLKGEIDPRSAEGGSLAQRTRRLILRLAGLPTLNLTATSEAFEVRK
jgi:hypothetical protein